MIKNKKYNHIIFNYLKNKKMINYKYKNDNTIHFYVNDKTFAILSNDFSIEQITLKLLPEQSQILRNKYQYILPSYLYMNSFHWNTIFIKAFDESVILSLIDLSYNLRLEKMTKKQKFRYSCFLEKIA